MSSVKNFCRSRVRQIFISTGCLTIKTTFPALLYNIKLHLLLNPVRRALTIHKFRNLSCEVACLLSSHIINYESLFSDTLMSFESYLYQVLCVVVKDSWIKFREKIHTSSHSTSSSAAADRATQTALLSPVVSQDSPHSAAAVRSPQRQDNITLFLPFISTRMRSRQ